MKTNVMMAAIIVILSVASNLGYSQSINLENLKSKNVVRSTERVKAFPNPAKDIITIQDLDANTSIALYNASGQLVKTEYTTAKGSKTLDISDLKSGTYFLEYTNHLRKMRDVTYLQITR